MSGLPDNRVFHFIFLCTYFLISSSAALNASNYPQINEKFYDQIREPKQAGFFEWLFGPPVTSTPGPKLQENFTTTDSSMHPFIHFQLSRNKSNSQNVHPNSTNSSNSLVRAEVLSYDPKISEQTDQGMKTSFDIPSKRIILPKPRRMRSDSPGNAQQIQITDIQHTIGSEINEPNLNMDPSQVNLKKELDAIDRSKRNSTQNSREKREFSSKFRQLTIPYGRGRDGIASSNNRINTLSKRQLLLTPAEQQMFALRQQQELATATMLQQHQLLNNYRNRYNNRYFDDYYDDDSSYEDSDEFYDQFNRYGMTNPMSFRIPPMHHPYGIGRRSLPDSEESGSKHEAGFPPKGTPINDAKRFKSAGVRRPSLLGPISKAGRWDTIEDYDLSSDFNKLQGKKGMGLRSGVHLGESHTELDENEMVNNESGKSVAENWLITEEKGRSSLGVEREDVTATSTLNASSISTSSATESITATSESSTPPTTDSEESSPPEESTSTTITGSTTDSEEEITTTTPPITETTTLSITTTKPATAGSTNVPPYRQTLNCRCGMQSVRGHDIGESTVVRTMVNPWLVAVRTRQKHLCSGSIINNKYILTSKSCVQGIKGLIVTAGMGSGIPKNFSVVRINEHEFKNIALLKVKPTISPNFAMRPICLPISHKSVEKIRPDTGTLVTFKRNGPKSNPVLQLLQTEVPMLSSAKCTTAAGGPESGSLICPGPPGSMKCGGDTGGTLQVYQKGYSYEQIAVVSTTVGCRANKTPGVYTDIRNSVKWILYITKDARYCRKPKVTPEDLINTKRSEVESNVKELETESFNDGDGGEEETLEGQQDED